MQRRKRGSGSAHVDGGENHHVEKEVLLKKPCFKIFKDDDEKTKIIKKESESRVTLKPLEGVSQSCLIKLNLTMLHLQHPTHCPERVLPSKTQM